MLHAFSYFSYVCLYAARPAVYDLLMITTYTCIPYDPPGVQYSSSACYCTRQCGTSTFILPYYCQFRVLPWLAYCILICYFRPIFNYLDLNHAHPSLSILLWWSLHSSRPALVLVWNRPNTWPQLCFFTFLDTIIFRDYHIGQFWFLLPFRFFSEYHFHKSLHVPCYDLFAAYSLYNSPRVGEDAVKWAPDSYTPSSKIFNMLKCTLTQWPVSSALIPYATFVSTSLTLYGPSHGVSNFRPFYNCCLWL